MGKKEGHVAYRIADHSADSVNPRCSQRSARRAQISTFLIVALVLVLFVAATFIIFNTRLSLQDKTNQAVISDLALFPPEQFVTHCVQQDVVDLSRIVLAQGGVWDVTAFGNSGSNSAADSAQNVAPGQNASARELAFTSFRAQPYLFWSRNGANEFITNDMVAGQINAQLPASLLSCINLTLYAQQGYDVQAGEIRTNLSIYRDTVHVVVYYPLKLKKGDKVTERTTFSADVDLPIGRMLEYGRDLTNSHLASASSGGAGSSAGSSTGSSTGSGYPNLPIDTAVLMHQTENIWQGKPLIFVDKTTVYPNTLYTLQLDYKGIQLPLHFAIAGVDVFSADFVGGGQAAISSCKTIDGACFSQVPYDLCVASGGEYSFGGTCPPPASLQTPLTLNDKAVAAFSGCTLDNGTVISSGASWCSAAGQGFIGVGSRASKLICVNGKIVQEPCQDYRTEVCAQAIPQSSDQLPAAQCRPNTALSCASCSDQSCCEARDCTFTGGVCVPKVPLGLPFWRSTGGSSSGSIAASNAGSNSAGTNAGSNSQLGIDICEQQYATALASVARTGKVLSALSQRELCAQAADCGATLSVVGERTQPDESGPYTGYYQKLTSFWEQQRPRFVSADGSSQPSNSQSASSPPAASTSAGSTSTASSGAASSSPAFAASMLSYGVFTTGLSPDANTGTLAPMSRSSPTASSLLSNSLADLEQLAAYDSKDYLNPTVNLPLNADEGICQPFVAPSVAPSTSADSCSYCSALGKACSEYVCRSLGASCRAILNASSSSGILCVDLRSQNSSGTNQAPLAITSAVVLNQDGSVNTNSPLTPSVIGNVGGYSYQGILSARDLLIVNLTTNRPALCKPTYLPSLSYSTVGSLDLSNGAPSTQHQLRLRFVNDLPVFDRILTQFSAPNYEQLVDTLATFKLRLDQLRTKYNFVSKYSPSFYPYLNAVVNQYLGDKTRPTLLALLDGVAQKKFAIFFVCQDELGNELSQNSFVQVQLASSCQPAAPKVLHIVPDADPYINTGFTLYLDKIGSCRFDADSYTFDSMRYNMSCASSEYDLSSTYDGTYACSATIPKELRNATQLYYSCADVVSNAIVARNITVTHDAAANSSIFFNLTANQITVASNQNAGQNATSQNISVMPANTAATILAISENATIAITPAYRCSLLAEAPVASSLPSPQNATLPATLSCTITNCTIAVSGTSLQSNWDPLLLTCVPRLPATSCVQTQIHASGPVSLSVARLPSLEYEDALIKGQQFVVTVRQRGASMRCSLSTETGQTYALARADNQTYVLSSSLLADNSLVKITCQDEFGTGPQYVSLVKK